MEFVEKRLHYRVSAGPCHEILTRWRDARKAIEDQHWSFVKSVGASGFFPGHDDNVGNATAISAAIFEGGLPKGWKVRKWKSFSNLSGGKMAGWPDQRTADGKAALKAIKALPLRPSTYGPCNEIGYPASLRYSGKDVTSGCMGLGFINTLTVGWVEDVFYVSLPDEARSRADLERDGYCVEGDLWTPLPGMECILKEEADLDYARHKAKIAASKVPA